MSNAAKVVFELKQALANLNKQEKLELLSHVVNACNRLGSIIQEGLTIPFVEVIEDDRSDVEPSREADEQPAGPSEEVRTDSSGEVDSAV